MNRRGIVAAAVILMQHMAEMRRHMSEMMRAGQPNKPSELWKK
jgi:hypothetical protein